MGAENTWKVNERVQTVGRRLHANTHGMDEIRKIKITHDEHIKHMNT